MHDAQHDPTGLHRPGLHVVVGASGQLGRELVSTLHHLGHRVRAVTRGRAVAVPPGVTAETGDIGDPRDAERLCREATVVYGCFGAPHRQWPQAFPRMMRGMIVGAARAGATIIYADNLYAYGPQTEPLVETMLPTRFGRKPRLRAELAAMLLDGPTPAVIGRAADFYGPGVDNAMLGASLVRSVLSGERVLLPGDIDAPHTFTFVPDFARALATLALADDVTGRVWHVPSAPAISPRAVVERLAAMAGTRARVARIPSLAVRAAAWVSPTARELAELAFQWDRPYLVSHARWAARFGDHHTALDAGLRATLAWVHADRDRPAAIPGGPRATDSGRVPHVDPR